MSHNDPKLVFPERAVLLQRTGAPSRLLAYLAAVVMLLLAAAFVVAQSGGIWQDWQIRRDPVVVGNAMTRNAVCKEYYVLFHHCRADVDYAVDGRRYQQALGFSFVAFHAGDWEVEVVRSRSHPEWITLDLGLDMIWNRMAVLLALPLLLLYVAGHLARTGKRNGASRAMEGQAFVFSAARVDIAGQDRRLGRNFVAFACDVDGKTCKFISMFRKGEAPFYLGDDKREALALRPPDGLPPVLLDEALQRVALTAAERDALRGRHAG